MPTFDPIAFRTTVAAFTPRRPERFRALSTAKELILELRQKRASHRVIAELLTQHGLPTGRSAVAAFCREILGEAPLTTSPVRPRRSGRRRGRTLPPAQPKATPVAAAAPEAVPPPFTPPPPAPQAWVRPRGPRIANLRTLKPPEP